MSNTITVVLDGDPTFDEFSEAMKALKTVLAQAARPRAIGPVNWDLDNLIKASAGVTVLCRAEDQMKAYAACSRVIEQARAARSGGGSPAMGKLVGLLSDRVPSIRFESRTEDVVLDGELMQVDGGLDSPGQLEAGRGAVRGRVQTLSSRGSLHFMLYDLQYDNAVSCYLDDDHEEQMRDVWGQIAEVTGLVTRETKTGRPLSIRNVVEVREVDLVERGAWRAAAGVLRGHADEPADRTVRRLRSV